MVEGEIKNRANEINKIITMMMIMIMITITIIIIIIRRRITMNYYNW